MTKKQDAIVSNKICEINGERDRDDTWESEEELTGGDSYIYPV